ncbi:murein biosynthesis integral membrane protein MurJ [Sulfurimonas sp. HSL-3221]|uniref:murein biosynthesis integral membrane protein MurJ n=1 Tax=Sulfurimonadaceae TaxID=2771471 RepID=UPI001E5E5724|nr:murein biosynthesis integral membrane protein MurJ [Sulfurimonas sp. HSL-3221]UFS63377.1 murein biosynthesis integral membrane protein MurJ [Sulfurimonas sp. HSL-3221]
MFKAIFTNSFGILFSRILGFARDLLTASVLGANIYSDIFFIAFKLPNLFRRVFAEGAFTQSFLPAFTRSKHKAVFSVHIFLVFLGIILLMTLAVNLFPALAAKVIALGFDADTVQMAAPYVAINFFYLPLIFAVTFLSTFLQYKNHFATTAFATGLLNIALIIALLLARGGSDETVVLYLSYGVVLGGFAQLFVHLLAIRGLGLHRLLTGGIRYYGRKAAKIREETRRFTREFFPAVWGNSTAQVAAFLDTWLASFLSAGVISYLYYANRVFQLPLALFAIATSIALFPKISRHLKHDNEVQARAMLERAFWFLLYLLSFAAVGGIVLAAEITQLLFERGAFAADDTSATALILQMYLVGLIPFGLGKLFSLWLYAQRRQSEAAKIATWSLGTNVVLSLALIAPLGGAGLALASSLGGSVALAATLRAVGRAHVSAIIRPKKGLWWALSLTLFTAAVLVFKELLHAYI